MSWYSLPAPCGNSEIISFSCCLPYFSRSRYPKVLQQIKIFCCPNMNIAPFFSVLRHQPIWLSQSENYPREISSKQRAYPSMDDLRFLIRNPLLSRQVSTSPGRKKTAPFRIYLKSEKKVNMNPERLNFTQIMKPPWQKEQVRIWLKK